MSDLQNFLFENQEVRFVGTADNPEWVAIDICNVLDLTDTSKALSDFDEDEKGTTNVRTLGGIQNVLTITESGLYRLIFKSRKPVAKRLQKWVFGEILPNIRKTGSYSVQGQTPTQTFLHVLQVKIR